MLVVLVPVEATHIVAKRLPRETGDGRGVARVPVVLSEI